MQSEHDTDSYKSTARQSPVALKEKKEVSPKSSYIELDAKVILS